MTDASKYPKAAKLQQQREEKFEAERIRQKAEAMLAKEAATMSVKMRNKTQQDECLAAEIAVGKKQGQRGKNR